MFSLYHRFLSPIFHAFMSGFTGSLHACRFTPTCSEYSRQAFARYSFPKAFILSLSRLLRCHPFAAGGYDPLPIK